jgi:DNA-binding response OmpR family regulator
MNASFGHDSFDPASDDDLRRLRTLAEVGIREVVIVDPSFDRYADFVAAAQEGAVGLHFCVDGRSAMRLARRFRADVWLVSDQLPDVSGLDLIEMLSAEVTRSEADPSLTGGSSGCRTGRGMRSGIFVVADEYRIEDEQRSLAAGVAGYLVRPVTIDVLVAMRSPAERLDATTSA